jgi:hypothetical protein
VDPLCQFFDDVLEILSLLRVLLDNEPGKVLHITQDIDDPVRDYVQAFARRPVLVFRLGYRPDRSMKLFGDAVNSSLPQIKLAPECTRDLRDIDARFAAMWRNRVPLKP